jgi:hypothetical protein
MAWIELHTVLIRHRKVNKLARTLNIKPVLAVGHLITLWNNVLELNPDGNITKWDIEDIASYSMWEGDPDTFYKALLNGGDGFIDECDGTRLVHDWFDYAGKYLTSKYRSHNPEVLDNIKLMYGHTKTRPNDDQNMSTNLTNQPTIVECLSYFYLTYEKMINAKYAPTKGKDWAIVKGILSTLSKDEFKAKVDVFFTLKDDFLSRAGYTMGVFSSYINKITPKPKGRGDV